MNEFTELLRIIQELQTRLDAQQEELDIYREHLAELTEQLYGTTERPEDQAA